MSWTTCLKSSQCCGKSLLKRDMRCLLPSLIVTVLISEEETDNVLYVTTCNPVSLYFMNVSSKNGYFVDLYDIFPRTVGHVWQPFVTVAPLGNPLKGQVILHEEEVRKIKKKRRPTRN